MDKFITQIENEEEIPHNKRNSPIPQDWDDNF